MANTLKTSTLVFDLDVVPSKIDLNDILPKKNYSVLAMEDMRDSDFVLIVAYIMPTSTMVHTSAALSGGPTFEKYSAQEMCLGDTKIVAVK